MLRRKPELGKYLLWLHFSKHRSIRRYLPATRRLTKGSFVEFVRKYQTVYVKPSGGSRGIGVCKVWTSGSVVYVKKTTLAARRFPSLDQAWQYIDRQRAGKAYIVQEGIHLARVNGRPFDVRVMMQRTSPGSEWKYSGMLAKVAGKSSVVTNVALSHGAVMEVGPALAKSFGWKPSVIANRMAELRRVARLAANHFDTYQRYRELGFDMAIDRKGKVWLIEENTAPSHPLFRKLTSNLAMWRTIEYRYGQYARAVHPKR